LERAAREKSGEVVTEESRVAGPAPRQDGAARGLGEALVPTGDGKNEDGVVADTQFVDVVAAGVARVA
jgi:hypothetical protein